MGLISQPTFYLINQNTDKLSDLQRPLTKLFVMSKILFAVGAKILFNLNFPVLL